MSRFLTKPPKKASELRPPIPTQPPLCSAAIAQESFSLPCLMRAIRIGQNAGLLCRTSYYFPANQTVSAKEILRYAEVLNQLLVYSKVFIVQNIDGDHSYSLRMDTVLQGRYDKDNLSDFLDSVRQDVELLLKYFSHQFITLQSSTVSARDIPLSEQIELCMAY